MIFSLFLLSYALAKPITLVESAPSETTLDNPDIVNVDEIWYEMVRNAKHTIQWASFYVSLSEEEDNLDPILDELRNAGERSVKIEILLDKSIANDNLESVQKIQQLPNTEVRFLDPGVGVMNARYLIVDGKKAYIGSHNIDWRSLEHIQELGVFVDDTVLSNQLTRIFSMDWYVAGNLTPFIETQPIQTVEYQEGSVQIVGSPRDSLPHPSWFDLGHIIQQIDDAKKTINIQVLTYSTKAYSGNDWHKLA